MRKVLPRNMHEIVVHIRIIQWNLSNLDTNGAEERVLISDVEMHARVVREASSFQLSGMEGFHCMYY